MNVIAVIFLMYFSVVCIRFIVLLNCLTLLASIIDSIITGSPVPMANDSGVIMASLALNAIGISMPKYSTALNGQKASANITPSKKLPINPLLLSDSLILFNLSFLMFNFSLIKSIITNPMNISSGPIALSPYCCNGKAIT